MINPILISEMRELILSNDVETIRQFCQQTHPGTVAELLEGLGNLEIWQILHMLDVPVRAEIFSHFELDKQVELVTGESKKEMARLLEEMPPDDRADLVNKIDDRLREEILPLVAKAEREDIRKLIAYKEGTAGAVMSTDYAVLKAEVDIFQAIEQLRLQATGKETIYYVYIINESRKLTGFVSLKDLILAKPGQLIKDVMHGDAIKANVNDDQEAVAGLIEKYDLIAIPIVDDNGCMVGIVTHDDALDIIRQEQTEDIEKLMAITGQHEVISYIKTPAWRHFKNRCGWIILLGIFGLVSGLIVQRFEALLVQFAILATFMPMLADTGGNTGSQSATLVIRALALQQISVKDILRVLLKELQVAIPLALLMAILAFGRLFLFADASNLPAGFSLITVGWAVALALGLQVITATLIGAALPLIASVFKCDPAVVASPALTTIVDITGLLIYFTTAKLMLNL
ncbi:MAG: magnesium transporter [Sedimentisphaerales bacterium]|nr:magnesium transporter [Sedimentisphaerales bacterium]